MQLRCLLFSGCLAAAESSLWGYVIGSRSTRLGLEPSAGFLRSPRKAHAPREEEMASALAGDALDVGDGLVLAQREAKLIIDKRKEARAPADAIEAAARRKLEEPPVEPLRPNNSGVLDAKASPENATLTPSPRTSASKKWDEIKSAQQEAKKAVTEGADLLNDDPVKHLMSWEAMLISNVATGEDEHAQPCIAHCRYGERVRHSWQECVERCVEDGMTRRMLLVGLPESERQAARLDAPLPAGMDELKKKRTARRRARSEDL